MDAVELIKRHEGLRLHVYIDTVGVPTIGRGRNLRDRGITEAEADALFYNDFDRARKYAASWDWFLKLTPPRQAVIIDMIFNLDEGGFSEFHHLHEALAAGDYSAAAAAMLNSQWAHQVGDRAIEDAQIMDTGEWIP